MTPIVATFQPTIPIKETLNIMTPTHQTTKREFLASIPTVGTNAEWSDAYTHNIVAACRAVLDERTDDDIVVFTKEQVDIDVAAFIAAGALRLKESTLNQYAGMYASACKVMRGEGRSVKAATKFRLAVTPDTITLNTAVKDIVYRHAVTGDQIRRIETEVEAIIAKILDQEAASA